MATNAISEKIQALRSETQPNSISPEMVGSIMQSIVDDLKSVEKIANDKGKLVVDNALSESSSNPVRNQVVTKALKKKADKNPFDPTIVVTGTNVRLTGEGSRAIITVKATYGGQLIENFNSPSDGITSSHPDSLAFPPTKIDWGELRPYIKEETKIVGRGVLQIQVTQSEDLPEGETFKTAQTEIVIAFHNRGYSHPIFASIDGSYCDDNPTWDKKSSVLTFEKFVTGVSPLMVSPREKDGSFVYCSDLNQFAYHLPPGSYYNNGVTPEGFDSRAYCEEDNKPRKNVIFVCKADNCAYISFDGKTLTKIKNL